MNGSLIKKKGGCMRNTDIDKAFFPVELNPLFYRNNDKESMFNENLSPVKNYNALIDKTTGTILSVVTNDYRLVTNHEAYTIGIDCYQSIFGVGDKNKFKIFNVFLSVNKTICFIDLLYEGYEINIYKGELYLPYLRIVNSYNKQRALSFELGFCRKLCSNGVIFEKQAIQLRYYHTKNSFSFNIDRDNLPEKFETLKNNFIDSNIHLYEISLNKKYALSLMMKIFDINITKDANNEFTKLQEKRIEDFIYRAESLLNKYINKMGENVYAIFNACTDYASNLPENQSSYFTDLLQRKAGNWFENFIEQEKKKDFSYENYLNDYLQLLRID